MDANNLVDYLKFLKIIFLNYWLFPGFIFVLISINFYNNCFLFFFFFAIFLLFWNWWHDCTFPSSHALFAYLSFFYTLSLPFILCSLLSCSTFNLCQIHFVHFHFQAFKLNMAAQFFRNVSWIFLYYILF